MRTTVGVIAFLWLVIGVFATWQRGYFTTNDTTCATAGTIALTVVAGPLNYAGVHPTVQNCEIPRPSQ